MTTRTFLHLDEFRDEDGAPACTAEGWAAWLTDPRIDDSFEHPGPIADGDTFDATIKMITYHDAELVDDNTWDVTPPIPETADTVCISFGHGLGWWPKDMFPGETEALACLEADGGIEGVLGAVTYTPMTATYHAPQGGQPARVTVETVEGEE